MQHPYKMGFVYTFMHAAEIPLRVAPSPPERFQAANAEEEMRKNKIGVLALVVMLAISVSCSRIGAPSDDAITTDIKAKMFSEPALKIATVDVASKHGEVTLTGQVPDDATRLAASNIASETKGVSRVNDQFRVAAAQMTAPKPATPARETEPAKRPAKAKNSHKAEKSRQVAAASPANSAMEPMTAGPAPAATPVPPPPPQPVTITVPEYDCDDPNNRQHRFENESDWSGVQGFAGCTDRGGQSGDRAQRRGCLRQAGGCEVCRPYNRPQRTWFGAGKYRFSRQN